MEKNKNMKSSSPLPLISAEQKALGIVELDYRTCCYRLGENLDELQVQIWIVRICCHHSPVHRPAVNTDRNTSNDLQRVSLCSYATCCRYPIRSSLHGPEYTRLSLGNGQNSMDWGWMNWVTPTLASNISHSRPVAEYPLSVPRIHQGAEPRQIPLYDKMASTVKAVQTFGKKKASNNTSVVLTFCLPQSSSDCNCSRTR